MNLLQVISDWSEVWALLIPLAVIIRYKPRGPGARLLIGYVIFALVLNSIATVMAQSASLPAWLKNNNIFYNIHSVVRVVLFSWYILSVRQSLFPLNKKWLLMIYGLLAGINFLFLESPLFLSTRLFAAESIILLIICLFYFLSSIKDETQVNLLDHSSFLVCTGVCLYEAITFFIFLFFYPLHNRDSAFWDPAFAIATMRIYTIIYVLFIILLAIGLFKSSKEQAPRKMTSG